MSGGVSLSKVWLITGSSRGAGRALADAVLADLVEHGNQLRAVALDVTDARAASDAIKTAVNAFGRVDVVVNNAGYGDVSSIEGTNFADFRAQIETNIFGVVNVTKYSCSELRRYVTVVLNQTTKAAIPLVREQGPDNIIIIEASGFRTD